MIDDMRHHDGWDPITLFNLPIGLRDYYAERLAKKLEKEAEEIDKASQKGRSK